jgi:hypothetical protein
VSINSRASIIARLQDPEYRALFVSEHIDTGLRFQIRALRESKGSQAQVSKEWGKAQPWICKLESPNYGKYSLSTLKEIAAFYDVGLLVQFVPFSTLADWTLRFPEEALSVPPFSKDVGLIERKPVASVTKDDPLWEELPVASAGGVNRIVEPTETPGKQVLSSASDTAAHNVLVFPRQRGTTDYRAIGASTNA